MNPVEIVLLLAVMAACPIIAGRYVARHAEEIEAAEAERREAMQRFKDSVWKDRWSLALCLGATYVAVLCGVVIWELIP